MTITNVEKKEKSIVELTISVDAETFEAAVQKVYLKQRGQIQIQGFRKGKATRKMIESIYGAEIFYQDAIEMAYPEAYAAAVKEQGLDEVGYPQLEIVEMGKEGFTFKAAVSVRPEVKVAGYKGLTAPKDVAEVTEEAIDAEMAPFVKRATRLISVDRAVENGDTAVIDFEGFDDGVAFEGGKGENFSLEIGSGSFVPGFEEQLIGMTVGAEADINITFPTDYVPELAGKPVVFKVKINEVKVSETPAIDDEFAKDVSEFDTLADFRADLAKKLAERNEKAAADAHEDSLMAQMIACMECEIPDTMIEVQMDRIMDDYAMRMQSQGMKLEDYVQMTGMDMNTLRESARPAATRQIEMELCLSAIAKEEGIEVTDEMVEAEIARLAEEYKMEVAQIKAAVPAETLKNDLLRQKASDVVLSSAKIGPAPEKKVEAPAEEAPAKPKRTRKKKVVEEAPAAE